MSPEQARGRPVDRRADIWSFGCVLFECLTGRRAFDGETASDIIAKILEREPDWSALPGNTPSRIRELLRRCLEKDVRKRQRDIGDVRMEIEEAIAARASGRDATGAIPAAPLAPSRQRKLTLAVGLLAVSAAIGYAGWAAIGGRAGKGNEPAAGPVRLSVTIPPTIRARYAGLTMDGSSVLVLGHLIRADGTDEPRGRIYIRRLDQDRVHADTRDRWCGDFLVLEAMESGWPSCSPLMSRRAAGSSKCEWTGTAPPSTIAAWNDRWQPSGVWLPDGDMRRCSPEANGVRPPSSRRWPTKAPGQVRLRFRDRVPDVSSSAAWRRACPALTLYVEQPRLFGGHLGRGRGDREGSTSDQNAGQAILSPTGHLLFSRGETLMGAPFDLARRAITGEATALVGGLRTSTWGHGGFDLADNGNLLYAPGGRHGADRRIATVDAKGNVTPFTSERRPYESNCRCLLTAAVRRSSCRAAAAPTRYGSLSGIARASDV